MIVVQDRQKKIGERAGKKVSLSAYCLVIGSVISPFVYGHRSGLVKTTRAVVRIEVHDPQGQLTREEVGNGQVVEAVFRPVLGSSEDEVH